VAANDSALFPPHPALYNGPVTRKRRWTVEALVVASLLAATAALSQYRPQPSGGARVERVIDGDTVQLSDGQKIRFLLIDTPERGEPFYREAVSANEELCLGKQVRIVLDREPLDDYGRTLAYLFAIDKAGNERFVNAELVRRGLAFLYVVGVNQARRDEILAAQREAAEAKRGRWAELPDEPGRFVGGRGASARHRFHRESCESVRGRKDLVDFPSRAEALLDGRSPCRSCKP
jgi:micrococcal nuclease